jgi:F420-dependent oxidoreductase-like protein
MLGLSYEEPAAHVREYLSVLVPLIKQGNVAFAGEKIRTTAALQIPDMKPCSVLISGLAPIMLRMAGEVADGTLLAWSSPTMIADHYLPKIIAAAEAAGRPRPRVCVLAPVAVTDDVEAARQQAAVTFEMYGRLPNYQRVLAREGAANPAELALCGDEAVVEKHVGALADAGATDLIAWVFAVGGDNEMQRTWECLGNLAGVLRAA